MVMFSFIFFFFFFFFFSVTRICPTVPSSRTIDQRRVHGKNFPKPTRPYYTSYAVFDLKKKNKKLKKLHHTIY
eukprot:NODE_32113_length_383_cov_0.808594.p1 GENE.NODE_32113_length_383_cov_0.808594~~NODE_32113_length_383_cov_0.808594.p1  ORF type:complete len:73 (+),score=5.79 NODE_32113_length_383_cov_0.808594:134-352(+)